MGLKERLEKIERNTNTDHNGYELIPPRKPGEPKEPQQKYEFIADQLQVGPGTKGMTNRQRIAGVKTQGNNQIMDCENRFYGCPPAPCYKGAENCWLNYYTEDIQTLRKLCEW